MYHTVSEYSNKVVLEVTREKSNVNETLEVLVENIVTSDVYLKSLLLSIGEGRRTADSTYYDDYNSISAGGAGSQLNYLGKNASMALPNVDYEPIKKIVKFTPGEVTKV